VAGKVLKTALTRALDSLGADVVHSGVMACEAEDASLRRAVSPEQVRRHLEAG
jgi:hypothetical protein